MSSLFSAIIEAANTNKFSSTGELSGNHSDQQAIAIEAGRAKGAFTEALNRLGQIIGICTKFNFGADIGFLVDLLDLAAKFEILVAKLSHLEFEIGHLDGQVGDQVMKLSIMQFLRDFADLFNGRQNVVDSAHQVTSIAIINLLIQYPNSFSIEQRDNLYSIALVLLEQEAGIYYPGIKGPLPVDGGVFYSTAPQRG